MKNTIIWLVCAIISCIISKFCGFSFAGSFFCGLLFGCIAILFCEEKI